MILHKLKKIGYEHLKFRSKSFRTKNFIFYFSTEHHVFCSDATHVGFTVTKKNVRKAVDRNRVKRLIRAGLSKYIAQNRFHDERLTSDLSGTTLFSNSIDKNSVRKVKTKVQQDIAVKPQYYVEEQTQKYVEKNIQHTAEKKTDTISLVNIVYARKSDSVSSLSLNEVHSDIEHFFTENSKDYLLKCN